jgi:NAD(P)-dependent dehydrogenase (short-subunit alcohol dehydrogenase family)
VPDPRVVLITGASSGIGRAAARMAAENGNAVVLVARGAGPLGIVASECESRGAASTLVLPMDLGDDDAVRDGVARALERYGRIDGVVHAAGVVAYGRTEDVPPEVFDGVLRTNLIGSVNLVRHLLPGMRERDAGVFVQIGSVIGHIAVPMMSPYAISKWGVRSLVRQLQIENRDRSGVHFCYLSPGGVDTPIYWQAGVYDGHIGRPPPPVVTPEHIARHAMKLLDSPRKASQVPVTNHLLRLGFTALPDLYDFLVRQLFPFGAKDLTVDTSPTAGNVLGSSPEGNQLRGEQGNALVGIARNVVRRLSG